MQLDTAPEPVTPEDPAVTLHRLRLLRQGIVLGLVAFSLLILLLALYLIVASVRNDVARSEANLGAAQNRLLQVSAPAPEVQALMATLTTTISLTQQLKAARPPMGLNWPAVVAALANYPPDTIILTSLTQVDNNITLTGQAVNDVVVVDYAHRLEASPLFASVVLQSLTLITAPTPAPTAARANAAPATVVPAPTVTPGSVNFIIMIELSRQAP